MCDCVPLMSAGPGTHQICPLHTVERHFVPNVHYLRPGQEAQMLSVLPKVEISGCWLYWQLNRQLVNSSNFKGIYRHSREKSVKGVTCRHECETYLCSGLKEEPSPVCYGGCKTQVLGKPD